MSGAVFIPSNDRELFPNEKKWLTGSGNTFPQAKLFPLQTKQIPRCKTMLLANAASGIFQLVIAVIFAVVALYIGFAVNEQDNP
jgi:hypothetical protein